MKRVFVSCHNPSTHGEVTWEGHEIVGYVDVTPGDKPSVGTYYQGWEAVPASVRGTIDIVLAMFCPVGGELERGNIKTLAAYPLVYPSGPQAGTPVLENDGTPMVVTLYDDVFVKAFALLKPGGSLLFPGTEAIADSSRELLEWKLPPPPAGQERNRVKNTVEFVEIGDVRPQVENMPEPEPEPEPEYSEEEDEDDEEEDEEEQNGGGNTQLQKRVPWLRITKPAGGGRRKRRRKTRRHPRSSRRRSIRS